MARSDRLQALAADRTTGACRNLPDKPAADRSERVIPLEYFEIETGHHFRSALRKLRIGLG
jgi:hypothetical protein